MSEGASAAGSSGGELLSNSDKLQATGSMGNYTAPTSGGYGDALMNGGSGAGGAGGYAVDSPYTEPVAATQGPTVDSANMQTYGTKDPSYMARGMNYLERFQKGGKQSLPQAYDKMGNNPETYGYIMDKAGSMGGGGGQAPQPGAITVNYQQPQNEYLRKRRGY